MKLIIDIPEGTYEFVKMGIINQVLEYKVWNAIKNSTPLDDVKAEIEQKAWDTQEIDGEHENYKVVDFSDVLQIIDTITKRYER